MFWAIGVILVNAYVVYITVLKQQSVNKKDILSHHDFRKAIALAWIDPKKYYNKNSDRTKTKKSSDTAMRSTGKRKAVPLATQVNTRNSIASPTTKKRKATPFSDKTVADHGALRIRLDTTRDHLPLPPGTNSRCAMHRCLGFETEKSVLLCPGCNVKLCHQCYRTFHTTPKIVEIKEKLRAFYSTPGNQNAIFKTENDTARSTTSKTEIYAM